MGDEAKKPGDPAKAYVLLMAGIALVLGYLLLHLDGQRREYERAIAASRSVFGTGDAPQGDAVPTTITGLAAGVHKYLETLSQATIKPGDASPEIPLETIKEKATGLGLQIQQISSVQEQPNAAKRYVEVSTTVTFDPTDLERLTKFMYNIEATSTRFRILDVRWELKPDKENLYDPGVVGRFGNAIGRPQVKIGFRRPTTGAGR